MHDQESEEKTLVGELLAAAQRQVEMSHRMALVLEQNLHRRDAEFGWLRDEVNQLQVEASHLRREVAALPTQLAIILVQRAGEASVLSADNRDTGSYKLVGPDGTTQALLSETARTRLVLTVKVVGAIIGIGGTVIGAIKAMYHHWVKP